MLVRGFFLHMQALHFHVKVVFSSKWFFFMCERYVIVLFVKSVHLPDSLTCSNEGVNFTASCFSLESKSRWVWEVSGKQWSGETTEGLIKSEQVLHKHGRFVLPFNHQWSLHSSEETKTSCLLRGISSSDFLQQFPIHYLISQHKVDTNTSNLSRLVLTPAWPEFTD